MGVIFYFYTPYTLFPRYFPGKSSPRVRHAEDMAAKVPVKDVLVVLASKNVFVMEEIRNCISQNKEAGLKNEIYNPYMQPFAETPM